MTSQQYYKNMVASAYPLENVYYDERDNKIVANVELKGDRNPAKILDANDFFSFPSWCIKGYTLKNCYFMEIRFHYGVGDYDVFKVSVADIIDCTSPGIDKIVVQGSDYVLLKSFRPEVKEDKAPAANAPATAKGDDTLFRLDPLFNSLFNYPSFGLFDFNKVVKEMLDEAVNGTPNEKNKDGMFCSFLCDIDNTGKVHVTRVDKNGTVDKDFFLGPDGKLVEDKGQVPDTPAVKANAEEYDRACNVSIPKWTETPSKPQQNAEEYDPRKRLWNLLNQ